MNKDANEMFIEDKINNHLLKGDEPRENPEKGILGPEESNLQVRKGSIMTWTPTTFEKHKGKTLPQLIFRDADLFFCVFENRSFYGVFAREAIEIYRRARCIRVPERNGQKMAVKYEIYKGKFQTIELIPYYAGVRDPSISRLIDFYVPRQYAKYDKGGYKNFVHALKGILFGDPDRYMTKAACEKFFDDDDNFDLAYSARKFPSRYDGPLVF